MTSKTVNEEACRLLKNVKVRSRLEELRAALTQTSLCTLQSHLATLATIRELAIASGSYAAATTAEIARGKAVGLYVDRIAVAGHIEHVEKPLDLSQLSEDELAKMHELLLKAGGKDTALH